MTFGATIAARMPIMITTTMISIRVNPRWRRKLRRCLLSLLTGCSRGYRRIAKAGRTGRN
jgi:hypothetical protein